MDRICHIGICKDQQVFIRLLVLVDGLLGCHTFYVDCTRLHSHGNSRSLLSRPLFRLLGHHSAS